MAPFSVIVFGDRFRRCSVDDSRIRSKTAPFSFENGLVWTGPENVTETPPPSYGEAIRITTLVMLTGAANQVDTFS